MSTVFFTATAIIASGAQLLRMLEFQHQQIVNMQPFRSWQQRILERVNNIIKVIPALCSSRLQKSQECCLSGKLSSIASRGLLIQQRTPYLLHRSHCRLMAQLQQISTAEPFSAPATSPPSSHSNGDAQCIIVCLCRIQTHQHDSDCLSGQTDRLCLR